MRKNWMILALASLAAACGDVPVEPASPILRSGMLAARGPEGRLPIVHVRPDAPPQAQGAVTNNLAEAVARVRPGGTIRVHPGTYTTQQVRITRPVTLEAAGAAQPTLDAAGAGSSLLIDAVQDGPVVIRGLRFVGASAHDVFIAGNYQQVRISDSEFHPTEQGGAPVEGRYYGSGVFSFGGSGELILVENSTFLDGAIGVHSTTPGLVVRNSRFVGQSNAAIHGPARLIEGNRVEGCGDWWCIWTSWAPGVPLDVVIRGNTLDTRGPPRHAIQVWGGLDPYNLFGGSATVESNSITYTDESGGPPDPARLEWGAGILFGHLDRMDATGNSVRNAHVGIVFQGHGTAATATGSDNLIHNVQQGVFVWDVAAARFNRNDITGYRETAATAINAAPDLPCNWWGSALGPTVAYVPPESFTPWATAPIANGAGGRCDGGLGR